MPATISGWLVALVEFYRWAALEGLVPPALAERLGREQFVRPGLRGGESGRTRSVRSKPLRVRVTEVETAPPWLSEAADREALLTMELRPRDRFLVDLLFYAGLRIGEALSLFRGDLHLRADNIVYGCRVRDPHVHIVRNESGNGARAKSLRVVPLPAELAFGYQELLDERLQLLGEDVCVNVFVALEGPTAGRALSYAAAIDVFVRISRVLRVRVRPHMLRHTRATIWVRGIEGEALDLDVVRVLLGHRSIASTLVYTHASQEALRAAVARLGVGIQGVES